jgi:hypothetical protein
MLSDRGIRKGVEVFVKDREDPDLPMRKAIVINTYPPPSRWLVVQYDSGDVEQVEADQITTMFEEFASKIRRV